MSEMFWLVATTAAMGLLAIWGLSLRRLLRRFEDWQAASPCLVIFVLVLYFVLGVDASKETGYADPDEVFARLLWFLLWATVFWGAVIALFWWALSRLPDNEETPDGEEPADEG